MSDVVDVDGDVHYIDDNVGGGVTIVYGNTIVVKLKIFIWENHLNTHIKRSNIVKIVKIYFSKCLDDPFKLIMMIMIFGRIIETF